MPTVEHFVERSDDGNPIGEALQRGGLQGLVAIVPVATWLHHKQTEAITKVLAEMGDDQLLNLRKSSEARAMLQSASKIAMKEPIVVGATIVAASMGHGAWHGYRHAQHATHRADANVSFREREQQRRERSSANGLGN